MRHQNPRPDTAREVGGIPPGAVMTVEFARLLARDVYVWGWPIVNAFRRRASFTSAPEPGLVGGVLPAAPMGYVAMLSQYIDPAQRWVAHPNQDVAYGFGYGAVDDDPVVLQVPDFGDRFWVYALYDARSDEFSKLGSQYGTEPGNYLVVGPHWDGEVPDGITDILRSPTELVAMGPRVFLDDSHEDREAVQATLSQVVIYPLSAHTGEAKNVDWRNVPHFPAPESTASETRWVHPETFFDELPAILDRVSALPGEESRYAMMRALLTAASSDPAIAEAIKGSAAETESEVIAPLFNFRTNGTRLAGGWNSPLNVARWGFDYLTRAATAKSNMYVNQPEETRYFFLEHDSRGRRLDGNHDYTITFPPGQAPPVSGFWSLTLYNPEHFFAPNDLGRYSLGTKNRTLRYEPDGSLIFRIQHESPGTEHESNWLPAPRGEFELTIRAYWPRTEVIDGSWTPPPALQA